MQLVAGRTSDREVGGSSPGVAKFKHDRFHTFSQVCSMPHYFSYILTLFTWRLHDFTCGNPEITMQWPGVDLSFSNPVSPLFYHRDGAAHGASRDGRRSLRTSDSTVHVSIFSPPFKSATALTLLFCVLQMRSHRCSQRDQRIQRERPLGGKSPRK